MAPLPVPRSTTLDSGEALRELSAAGVPTTVMAAPMIPALNDHEMEKILETARDAGATRAAYVLLRLPLEIKDLFREWLQAREPGRASHVMSLIRSMRGGRDYDSQWGKRMKGAGPYAQMMAKRFAVACERLRLNEDSVELRTVLFKPPPQSGDQLRLI